MVLHRTDCHWLPTEAVDLVRAEIMDEPHMTSLMWLSSSQLAQ